MTELLIVIAAGIAVMLMIKGVLATKKEIKDK